MTKTCWNCQKDKPLESFYKSKRRSDGRSSECKVCQLSGKKRAWKVRRKTINEHDLLNQIMLHANLTKETWNNLHRWTGDELLLIFKKSLNDLETHTTDAGRNFDRI